jgi:hypothetical protein
LLVGVIRPDLFSLPSKRVILEAGGMHVGVNVGVNDGLEPILNSLSSTLHNLNLTKLITGGKSQPVQYRAWH